MTVLAKEAYRRISVTPIFLLMCQKSAINDNDIDLDCDPVILIQERVHADLTNNSA